MLRGPAVLRAARRAALATCAAAARPRAGRRVQLPHYRAGLATVGLGAAAAAAGPAALCRAEDAGESAGPGGCCAQMLPSFLMGAAVVALQQWYDVDNTGTGLHKTARAGGTPRGGADAGQQSGGSAEVQALPTTAFSYKVVGGGEVEYRGEVRSAGSQIPHGRGVKVFPDGSVYSGEFVDGEHEGKGRISKQSGDVYDGNWRNGQPHGHGVETYMSGERYEGYWKDGRKVGKGKFKHADGYVQLVRVERDGKLTVIK